MNLIKFLLGHSRMLVLCSLFAGVLSGASNVVLLGIVSTALKRNGSVSVSTILAFIGLCMLLPISRLTAELLLNKLGQQSLYELRMRLSRQVLGAPLRQLEQLGTHRVLAALTDDVPSITNAIVMVPGICVNAVLVIGCMAYMAWLSWMLFTIVLGFMALGVVGYHLPLTRARKAFRAAREQADFMLGHFRALTQGTKELKLNQKRRQDFLSHMLDPTALSLRNHNLAGLRTYSAASSWGQAMVFIVIGVIIFLLPSLQGIRGPALTGYTLTLLYLMSPMQIIMNMLPNLSRATVALQRIKELGFELEKRVTETNSSYLTAPALWRRLEFKSVTHVYHREGESQDFVVGPLEITFRAGEVVFVTGGNGSGKTTFVKLLTGLYAPEAGQILMDAQPVTAENREHYRQHFSAVFFDFYLFEQLLGLDDAALDSSAQSHLEQLKLAHKVKVKDGRLSTIDLSQGQRKRLALLSAYLEDRPIYVFDEWAADQDPYFKSIFYLQLIPELKARKKTVFVITHDDKYYDIADRLVKMEDGQIMSDVCSSHALVNGSQF